MPTPPQTCDKPSKYCAMLFVALILAGLAGNHFKFSLFLNIEFLFGSIFAMLALQFLGLGRGILAALLISSYTFILWDHPYAIIIMTAEVAAVAWLTTRRKVGMVLADTLFWLILGMPLIFLFYLFALDLPQVNAYIITTNQAMNGIANVLAARLIYTGFVLRLRSTQMSYREIVYNLLAFFVLCPSLILLSVGSKSDFIEAGQEIRSHVGEQPSIIKLYKNYTGKLTILFLTLIGSLVLAEYLSRKIVVPLGKLRDLTHELPDKLVTDGKEIVWPQSGIKEVSHLINNFREMADSLSEQFARTWRINESLEKRVGERTEELNLANTELKSEINERKIVEKALSNSMELYHSLVETSQDIIWQCDPEGRFTFLNLAAEQVFGYELDEMLGKKFTDFQTEESAEFTVNKFIELMEGGSLDSFETVFKAKSGKEIYLEIKSMFVRDEHGDIVSVSGTAYDFTGRKLLETELLQAKASAEAANIAKSNFLATMSHEVRTPMNCVIGMLQLIQQSGLTVEQQEYAESAKKAGFDLVHLLNDILDLSKIEADKIELEKNAFNLQREISDITNILLPLANEKGLKLSASIESDVPVALKGDSGRLRQIIINLVGNAVKFTPEGSVRVQVRKEAEDEESATLMFLIKDTGIGIAADKLEQVFEFFTQADSSTTRTFGGTGLGLAISRRLVELMGGTIDVISAEGQGSTFRFTVVLEKEIQPALPFPGSRAEGARLSTRPGEEGGIPIRILLTDDDQTARSIVPKLLKSHGYQVDVAADGKEALKALETNKYALVLMDCMMPGMNGYQVTSVIRDPASSVLRHDIPVIALTGNAMQQDRDECIAAGMDDHLSKPLLLPDLLAMMEKWLKKPA